MPTEAVRVVEVATSRFRLVGDPALVELSRAYVYPLPPADSSGDAPEVRLSASARGVGAEGPFGAIEAASADELLERLDYELTRHAMESLEGVTALHAGCVGIKDGRPLLLLGVHTSGKSTMAAALARLGLPLWCDDITLVRRAPFGVRPLPRVIRVRADSARLLGVSLGTELTHRVPPEPWREGWAGPVAAVEVKFQRGNAPVMSRLSAPESTTTLLKSVFGFRDAMAERLGVMAELEHSAPMYRFTHGLEPMEAARRLVAELEAVS